MTSFIKSPFTMAIITTIICIFLMVFLATRFNCSIQDTLSKRVQYYDSCRTQLGEKIVINNDTLILLSFDNGDFVLSNGVKISPKVVKKIGLLNE
jgi:hypothetical protein